MSDYTPPGHPLITINLHRQGGKPCLKGTRLPARQVAAEYLDRAWARVGVERRPSYPEGEAYAWVRMCYGEHITDTLIDAAVAWESDPEHKRIERNAHRRQKYAERRAG